MSSEGLGKRRQALSPARALSLRRLDDDASAPSSEPIAAARNGQLALLHEGPEGIDDQRRILVCLLRLLLCGKPLDEGAFGDSVTDGLAKCFELAALPLGQSGFVNLDLGTRTWPPPVVGRLTGVISAWAMRHRRSFGAKKVGTDSGGDAGRRVVYGVAREMRVSGGGLDLRVTEKSGDHRQALAKRQSPRRPAVPEVVKPNIFERGACPCAAPLLAEAGDPRAGPGGLQSPRDCATRGTSLSTFTAAGDSVTV